MIFQFYGADWLAIILTFLALHAIGNKQRYGFITMMLANLSWVFVGMFTGSMAIIGANLVFCGMNLRAAIKWSRPDKVNA